MGIKAVDAVPIRVGHKHRLPVLVAIIANLALILFIPETVQLLPRWVIPALGVMLLTPLLVFNRARLSRETTWSRWLSFALAILLTVANRVAVDVTSCGASTGT